MVINRGGKKVVTVDILQDNYNKVKAKAIVKKMKVRQVVNDMIADALAKEEFIARVAPFLSIDSYQDNIITVKDVHQKVLIDVYYKEGDLWCEKDENNHCAHTKFVWMAPEIARMVNPNRNGGIDMGKKTKIRLTV
jgi:hypothetical protein